MKAEPESRLEKGHDIKFSVDDLASKTEPEPWDGKLSAFGSWSTLLMQEKAFEIQLVRNSQALNLSGCLTFIRSSEQPTSHEERRPGILLPLQLQSPRHCGHYGDCKRAFS